jgi:hypothetical protein
MLGPPKNCAILVASPDVGTFIRVQASTPHTTKNKFLLSRAETNFLGPHLALLELMGLLNKVYKVIC